jgi:hypothetical protein
MSNEPTQRNIIGIFGKSKSGKNTVGDMIASTYKGTTQIAFADKLKQVCMELFGLTSQDLNTEEGKAKPTLLPCPTCPMCRSINVVAAPTMLSFASFYDQPVVNHKGPRQAECKAVRGGWISRLVRWILDPADDPSACRHRGHSPCGSYGLGSIHDEDRRDCARPRRRGRQLDVRRSQGRGSVLFRASW